MLNIRALTFNLLQERCYVAWSEAGRCVIADPGCDGPAELQTDRKSTRLNSSHKDTSRMPSSA